MKTIYKRKRPVKESMINPQTLELLSMGEIYKAREEDEFRERVTEANIKMYASQLQAAIINLMDECKQGVINLPLFQVNCKAEIEKYRAATKPLNKFESERQLHNILEHLRKFYC